MKSKTPVYAEPFCGGAGIAINLLTEGKVDRILLNDLDVSVYSAWYAIVNESDRFIDRLKRVSIDISEWYRQKEIVTTNKGEYDFDLGFATFFLNRTNRAGIVVGSGPIGGYSQSGIWKIDARFYRETMIKRIEKIKYHRNSITISNLKAEDFIMDVDSDFKEDAFLFIDPPYYEAGSRLYFNGMQYGGHEKLANLMKADLNCAWIMTYDDHEKIRELYSEFSISQLEVVYSLQRQRKVNEVLIQAAMK